MTHSRARGEPPERIPCPTCRRRVVRETPTFPFCSSRCRDIDLGNWFEEKYRIPSSPSEEDELPDEADRQGEAEEEDGDGEAGERP